MCITHYLYVYLTYIVFMLQVQYFGSSLNIAIIVCLWKFLTTFEILTAFIFLTCDRDNNGIYSTSWLLRQLNELIL